MSVTLKRYQSLLESEEYIARHKKSAVNFTRNRKLPFLSVLTILARKSVKSLQLVLNEWSEDLENQATASALSQARQKISHTAFIELLEKCVVEPMYEDGDFNTYKGHRLLAIDGSTLRLPTSEKLIEEFGLIEYMGGKQKTGMNNVESKISVLYDVLNEIPISGSLHRGRTNDIKASSEQVALLKDKDILVADRGYGSYGFFSDILGRKANYIVRLKGKTYQSHHKLMNEDSPKESVVDIHRPYHLSHNDKIAESMEIRFLKIKLPDGEIEILATSLTDLKKYPFKDFKKLYYKRWRIETYFQTLKSRLSIDNFTGRTVEAIQQDFYSTLFISGLETIISEDAQEELDRKETEYPQKVNKAISFHAIKNEVLLLMLDPPDDFQDRIKKIFLKQPTLVRSKRKKDNIRYTQKSNDRSLWFQRYARKHVF